MDLIQYALCKKNGGGGSSGSSNIINIVTDIADDGITPDDYKQNFKDKLIRVNFCASFNGESGGEAEYNGHITFIVSDVIELNDLDNTFILKGFVRYCSGTLVCYSTDEGSQDEVASVSVSSDPDI